MRNWDDGTLVLLPVVFGPRTVLKKKIDGSSSQGKNGQLYHLVWKRFRRWWPASSFKEAQSDEAGSFQGYIF